MYTVYYSVILFQSQVKFNDSYVVTKYNHLYKECYISVKKNGDEEIRFRLQNR